MIVPDGTALLCRAQLDLLLIKVSLWGQAYGGCPVNVAVATGAYERLSSPGLEIEQRRRRMGTCPLCAGLISFFTLTLYIWRFKASERFGRGLVQDKAEGAQRSLRDLKASLSQWGN